MNYTIQQITSEEEVKAAFEMALRAFMEFVAPVYEDRAVRKFKADTVENNDYINNYITSRHLMLGAFDGEQIIGMITERGGGHISMVFTDKEYQRRGVATAIMERMVVRLKLMGHNRVTVNSSRYGLPFYRNFGFVPIDTEQNREGFIFTPMEYFPSELWDVYDRSRRKTGKIHERGRKLTQDEYHIVVHVWIKNSNGEWLISKRTPNKTFPNMWECTGGSAVMGDDSITAAVREVKEELGVDLPPEKGVLFKSIIRENEFCPDICDIWVFHEDIPLESVVFQENETCGAMWASEEKIRDMIGKGEFVGKEIFSYLDELLEQWKMKVRK